MREKINKKKCEQPERLKGKPEECASGQIKRCHGNLSMQKHPCASKKK